MGRAPAFWTEENTRLIRQNFVSVALSVREYERSDAVGRFLRDSGIKLANLEGCLWGVTAGGKILESNMPVVEGKPTFKMNFDLKAALEKWQALPEEERAPGAVKVGEMGAVDTQHAELPPPDGAVILKLFYRAFMRDGNKVRYLTGQDLWLDEKGGKTVVDPGMTMPQAQPDHMWLTEAEGKSLMPAAPRVGDTFPMPEGIADRLVRRHLNPRTLYDGHSDGLDRGSVRAAHLNLTVESLSEDKVRLRLDGQAKLGKEPAPDVMTRGVACTTSWGYDPTLLGFLEYDPGKKVFTRFDVVAWGDQFGRVGLTFGAARPGCQPLGISFELVQGNRPADRVPPGSSSNARPYFDPKALTR